MTENFEQLLESYIQRFMESAQGKTIIETSLIACMNQICISRLISLQTWDYDPFNLFPHHGQQVQALLAQCNIVKSKLDADGLNVEQRDKLCNIVTAIYSCCESLELLQAFGKDNECQLSIEIDCTINNNSGLLSSISTVKPSMTREEFLSLADSAPATHKPSMTREEFLSLADDSFNTFPNTPPQRAEESKLRKLGYSVAQDNDMTEAERHSLLKSLIVHRIVSKGYVISYLKHMIQINGKKEANYIAVSKWKNDLDYIMSL